MDGRTGGLTNIGEQTCWKITVVGFCSGGEGDDNNNIKMTTRWLAC